MDFKILGLVAREGCKRYDDSCTIGKQVRSVCNHAGTILPYVLQDADWKARYCATVEMLVLAR